MSGGWHGRFSVNYRLAEDAGRLHDDLATLRQLHAARWTEGDSEAFSGARRDFHEEFAAYAQRKGWLRLWFLELDGRPVAAWHGFRYGGADWFYQAGRNPRYDDLSVGFALMAHTVREAARDGMHTYHLLRGDDAYKARFADADRVSRPSASAAAPAAAQRARAQRRQTHCRAAAAGSSRAWSSACIASAEGG